jgi:hypothetical protein
MFGVLEHESRVRMNHRREKTRWSHKGCGNIMALEGWIGVRIVICSNVATDLNSNLTKHEWIIHTYHSIDDRMTAEALVVLAAFICNV